MGNDTKQNLLKATRDLIDNKGIADISMRTVGRAAHLSRGALYRHFDNKESLLAAIVIENFHIMKEKFAELEEKIRNPRQLLFELSIQYYNFGINNPDHYQLMFNTKWDEGKYPDVKQAAIDVFNKFVFFVSMALKSRQLNQKLLLEKTAVLYACIHGVVELHLAGHNKPEKGLNDITPLINHALESIIKK